MKEQTALTYRMAKKQYKAALCKPSPYVGLMLASLEKKIVQAAQHDPCPLAQYRAEQLLNKFNNLKNK